MAVLIGLGGGVDTSEITITESDVKSGKTFIDANGELKTGTYSVANNVIEGTFVTSSWDSRRREYVNSYKTASVTKEQILEASYATGYFASIPAEYTYGTGIDLEYNRRIISALCLNVSNTEHDLLFITGGSGSYKTSLVSGQGGIMFGYTSSSSQTSTYHPLIGGTNYIWRFNKGSKYTPSVTSERVLSKYVNNTTTYGFFYTRPVLYYDGYKLWYLEGYTSSTPYRTTDYYGSIYPNTFSLTITTFIAA